MSIELFQPSSQSPAVIRVKGLDSAQLEKLKSKKLTIEEWNALFRVVVAGANEEESNSRPAVIGTYRIENQFVIFEPRFPLAAGTPYFVMFDTPKISGMSDHKKVSQTLTIPKPDSPAATITAVYPSSEIWPENTLRMYIHFSAPMSQGHVYEYLKLLRDDGKVIEKPFIEIDEELWNPDCTRLTVLFDPGRIKNGLASKAEAGPNLENGKKYTLQISNQWKDANGRELQTSFKRKIQAGPFDHSVIDPEKWMITPPIVESQKALMLHFPTPLDRGLLNRMITIQNDQGKEIDGEITISNFEKTWMLTPKKNWQKGTYQIVVDTRLEDVCGNRVGSPFEIDVFRNPTRRLETKTVKRPFVVK